MGRMKDKLTNTNWFLYFMETIPTIKAEDKDAFIRASSNYFRIMHPNNNGDLFDFVIVDYGVGVCKLETYTILQIEYEKNSFTNDKISDKVYLCYE